MAQINLMTQEKQLFSFQFIATKIIIIFFALFILLSATINWHYSVLLYKQGQRIDHLKNQLADHRDLVQRLQLQEVNYKNLLFAHKSLMPFQKLSTSLRNFLQILTETPAEIILRELVCQSSLVILMGESYSMVSFEKWIKYFAKVDILEFKNNAQDGSFYFKIKVQT